MFRRRSLLLVAAICLILSACAAPSTPIAVSTEEVAQQASALRARGDDLRVQGAFAEAIAAYEQSLALAPDDAETNAGLGAALLGLGRNEDALPPLQRATELDPQHYWAHRLLGVAYLNLQRYGLAADYLTQAYILDSSDPQLLIGIALALGRSGQRDLALRTLDQFEARTSDPKLLSDANTLRQEFSTPGQ